MFFSFIAYLLMRFLTEITPPDYQTATRARGYKKKKIPSLILLR